MKLINHHVTSVSLGILILLTHSSLAQSDIQPPNSQISTVISNKEELLTFSGGFAQSGVTLLSWPTRHGNFSIYTYAIGVVPGANFYYAVLENTQRLPNSFEVKKVTFFLELPSPSIYRGNCQTEIVLRLVKTLEHDIVRLELDKIDVSPVGICGDSKFVNVHRTRLAFFFNTDDVLTCLACEIPLEEERYTAPSKSHRQDSGLATKLEANLLDKTLIISAVTPSVSQNQKQWMGTYTLP
jgi:hypothetical protein